MFPSVLQLSSLDLLWLLPQTLKPLCSAQRSSLSVQPWKQHPEYKKEDISKVSQGSEGLPLFVSAPQNKWVYPGFCGGDFHLILLFPVSYHLLKQADFAVVTLLECTVLWNSKLYFHLHHTLWNKVSSWTISISGDDASVRHGSSPLDPAWRLWSHFLAKLAFDS